MGEQCSYCHISDIAVMEMIVWLHGFEIWFVSFIPDLLQKNICYYHLNTSSAGCQLDITNSVYPNINFSLHICHQSYGNSIFFFFFTYLVRIFDVIHNSFIFLLPYIRLIRNPLTLTKYISRILPLILTYTTIFLSHHTSHLKYKTAL